MISAGPIQPNCSVRLVRMQQSLNSSRGCLLLPTSFHFLCFLACRSRIYWQISLAERRTICYAKLNYISAVKTVLCHYVDLNFRSELKKKKKQQKTTQHASGSVQLQQSQLNWPRVSSGAVLVIFISIYLYIDKSLQSPYFMLRY